MDYEVVWNGTMDRMAQRYVPPQPARSYEAQFLDKPTPTQERILNILRMHGALTRHQILTHARGLTFNAVSSAVGKMEGLGLIERVERVRDQSSHPSWTYRERRP